MNRLKRKPIVLDKKKILHHKNNPLKGKFAVVIEVTPMSHLVKRVYVAKVSELRSKANPQITYIDYCTKFSSKAKTHINNLDLENKKVKFN